MDVIPAVLAIDGGNSKTALALVSSDGSVLASLRGPGASHEAHGIDEAMRRLGDMVSAVAARAGVSRGSCGRGPVARHTSACLAGADLPEEETALTAALTVQGWSATATAMNDTFAVLRAGLRADRGEPSHGVAVTCGAGINCVAVGPDRQVARYQSWGRISGDWGGGGDLGAEAVWHAIRAEDGRGPATALAAAVPGHFGLASVADVAAARHTKKISRDDVRQLTPVLMAVAEAGDPVAHGLLARQAGEIRVMATAAMKRIGMTASGAPVVLGGGVLESRNPLLLSMVMSQFAEHAPGALPRVVDVPPVAGAALLGLDRLEGGAARRSAEFRVRQAFGDVAAPGTGLGTRRRRAEVLLDGLGQSRRDELLPALRVGDRRLGRVAEEQRLDQRAGHRARIGEASARVRRAQQHQVTVRLSLR